MQPIVEVFDLKKQYNPPDGIIAVDGISFSITRGEIFSLLGPNGAGKTTAVSILSCLLKATAELVEGELVEGSAGHTTTTSTVSVSDANSVEAHARSIMHPALAGQGDHLLGLSRA